MVKKTVNYVVDYKNNAIEISKGKSLAIKCSIKTFKNHNGPRNEKCLLFVRCGLDHYNIFFYCLLKNET